MSSNAAVTSSSTLSRLSPIAEGQWGLVTRRQAEHAGVSRATLQRLASNGVLRRVAHSVYQLSGAPTPELLELRAAWLQLAPNVPAWERSPEQGVVSHRSAAAAYGLNHPPADRHEFTLPVRRQSRRPDVRLHHRLLHEGEWASLGGLPVTRPPRIASDLLNDNEEPAAVARLVANAIREGYEEPGTFAASLAPFAQRFGLRRNDGLAVFARLLELVGDPAMPRWLREAWAQREPVAFGELDPAGRP